jgi:hypothetical protein
MEAEPWLELYQAGTAPFRALIGEFYTSAWLPLYKKTASLLGEPVQTHLGVVNYSP